MIEWSNLFTGYNVYLDVFGSYNQIYTDLSSSSITFDFYHQIILQLPYDVRLLFEIFITSIIPITILSALVFTFFMPILKKPQQW